MGSSCACRTRSGACSPRRRLPCEQNRLTGGQGEAQERGGQQKTAKHSCQPAPLQASWGDAAYQATLLLPLQEALLRCWADTDALFSGIGDWRAQPIPLRHPFLFYYGHTAAFARLKILPSVRLSPGLLLLLLLLLLPLHSCSAQSCPRQSCLLLLTPRFCCS